MHEICWRQRCYLVSVPWGLFHFLCKWFPVGGEWLYFWAYWQKHLSVSWQLSDWTETLAVQLYTSPLAWKGGLDCHIHFVSLRCICRVETKLPALSSLQAQSYIFPFEMNWSWCRADMPAGMPSGLSFLEWSAKTWNPPKPPWSTPSAKFNLI